MKRINYLLVGIIFLSMALMVAGGMMQLNQSGLNCPSWPICYAENLSTGGALLPIVHRVIGGIVFLLSLILYVLVINHEKSGKIPTSSSKKAGAMFGILFLEGLLGGATAVYRLPTIMSLSHFVLSIVFLLMALSFWYFLNDKKLDAQERLNLKSCYRPSLRHGVLFTFGLVFIQALFGVLVNKSGAGKACGLGVENVFICVEQGVSFFFWGKSEASALNMSHRLLGILSILSSFYFSIKSVQLSRSIKSRKISKELLNISGSVISVASLMAFVAKNVLLFENRDLYIVAHFILAVVFLSLLWILNKKLEWLEDESFPLGIHNTLSDMVMLTKPRLASLVMLTVAVGIFLAPGQINFFKAVLSFLLIHLVVMGAAILNCYIERDVDKLMERTKDRPLPAGRMKPAFVLVYGVVCLVISLPLIYIYINPITAYLSALAAALYLWAYTPLKLKSPTAVYVGAIPGAIPPVLGVTIVSGQMDALAWILFFILFIWQLPHFMAISIYHAKDYGAASIKVYPNQNGYDVTKYAMILLTIILGGVAYMPFAEGLASKIFAWISIILSSLFTLLAVQGVFIKDNAKQESWAKNYFWASIVYLPMLLGSMIFFR